MSLMPIVYLCDNLQMEVINVSIQNIHGGSLRVEIANEGVRVISESVDKFYLIEKVSGFDSIERYSEWGIKVDETIKAFGDGLLKLKKSGAIIGGFAASAKGATLLNCAGINTDILDWIADETPDKINKFQPGTGIPIVHKSIIMKCNPDYIVILSWNFTQEIKKRVRALGYKGKFIVPLPLFEIQD
jgi:hypothetical protein